MYATDFEHWLPLPCSAEVTLPFMRLRTYIVARSFVKNSPLPPPCYRLPGPVRGVKNCYRRAYQRGWGGLLYELTFNTVAITPSIFFFTRGTEKICTYSIIERGRSIIILKSGRDYPSRVGRSRDLIISLGNRNTQLIMRCGCKHVMYIVMCPRIPQDFSL